MSATLRKPHIHISPCTSNIGTGADTASSWVPEQSRASQSGTIQTPAQWISCCQRTGSNGLLHEAGCSQVCSSELSSCTAYVQADPGLMPHNCVAMCCAWPQRRLWHSVVWRLQEEVSAWATLLRGGGSQGAPVAATHTAGRVGAIAGPAAACG